jgi:hypothetical protein
VHVQGVSDKFKPDFKYKVARKPLGGDEVARCPDLRCACGSDH